MAEELTVDSQKSYGQILKTTAVFGSVKIFSVLIGLFKAKIIAIFLGPAGMGIFNLINYPVTLFSQFSGLGISTSGIREVAQTEDEKQLSETSEVIKYWNRTLGIVGSIILFALASWVSKLSFGDESYTWAFQVLSVVVFLTNLGSEYEVLLRGRRETKLVAKAGFYSSLAGFIASIPFYYAFGIPGIVVVILITALTLAGVNYLYARKLNIQPIKLPYREIFKRGQNMASIGFFIVLGDLIFVSVITIVNTFIRSYGGVEDVGYFQACMQITQTSLNTILLAMAADYFPKLSKLQGNIKETRNVLSQQGEVATLLCTPIIIGMIAFSPLIIRILLSEAFLIIHETLIWFLFAALLRLPMWANKYVILANGKTKLFVILEVINSSLLLLFFYFGYKFFGIRGLAWGFIVQQVFYTLILCSICSVKMKISFETFFWKTLGLNSIPVLLVVGIYYLPIEQWMRYVLYCVILIVSSAYCLQIINQRSGIIIRVINRIYKK